MSSSAGASIKPRKPLVHLLPGACLLGLALLAAVMGRCSEAPLLPTAAPDNAPITAPASVDADFHSDSAIQFVVDISRVDRKSAAYDRFKSFVDEAVAGDPGYEFSASDAALLYRIAGGEKYCALAVSMVDKQVADAEAAIAKSQVPEIAGDSYLQVGPHIADLSLTLDSCATTITAQQHARWSAYAEQAVWNVWHPASAQWGGHPAGWSGWSVDNPGNNYYYSFLEATMYWALVSKSSTWMQDLRQHRLPPLQEYFAQLQGGGSREGTGYGVAQMRLFSLYRLWRDSTGEDLAARNTHARDTIDYWVHATVPTLDRFAPIGDQSRSSVPELYDYHRRLMLETRSLTRDPTALQDASWWLHHISIDHMTNGFNSRHDLLDAGRDAMAPTALTYLAKGTGHFFARTGWDKQAMWVAVTAGPYDESHAHQEQGSFTLFARDWLVVTQNIWTHSGIQQGTEYNNLVRFERANPSASQCGSPAGDVVVHQCENDKSKATLTVTPSAGGAFNAVADLTPVYRGNQAVRQWQRRFDFGTRKLTVSDHFLLDDDTRAIFQLNVPVKPVVQGNEVVAGKLRIRILQPAQATVSVVDWKTVDRQDSASGWRIDISGAQTDYAVELSEQ